MRIDWQIRIVGQDDGCDIVKDSLSGDPMRDDIGKMEGGRGTENKSQEGRKVSYAVIYDVSLHLRYNYLDYSIWEKKP